MKNFLKASIFVLIYVVSILVLYFCRTVPYAKIWDNYNVAYIENSLSEEKALQYFYDAGCKDVISKGQQKIPELEIEIPVIQSFDRSFDSYLEERLSYFKDKDGTFQLFYIPTSYEALSVNAVTQIQKKEGVRAGLDDKEAFPWLMTSVCLAFFIFLFFMAENKKIFFFPGLLFTAFGFFVPEHGVQAAVIMSQLTLFMIQRVWRRKFALKKLFKSPYFDILLTASIVMFILTSLKTFLFSLMISFFMLVCLKILKDFEVEREKMHTFKFDMLFTANHFEIMTKRNAIIIVSALIPMTAILIIFLLQAKFLPKTTGTGLLIPSPRIQTSYEKEQDFSHKEDENTFDEENLLPVIDDFYEWTFKVEAYPYRNLYDTSWEENINQFEDNKKITLTRYMMTEDGIVEYEDTLLEYNSDFEKEINSTIKKFDYPAIEKFLLNQDRGIEVAYSASANTKVQNDSLSLVVILIALFVPLLLTFAFFLSETLNEKNKNLLHLK